MAQQDAEIVSLVARPLPVAVSGPRQWYLIAVLTTIYTLSFLDRGALNLMVNPIKADMGITDVQMSLLIGLAFLLLFSLCAIPFGYLVDRFSRRTLVGGAVFFWSCMSATCGFAGSYWQLFFGRTGLGVGEAALQPAGFSLIRDSFPPQKRAIAFSIYQMGPVLGTGLATLVGGALYAFAANGHAQGIPLLGQLKPWQFAIAVPGICGLPLALLMLTIREPQRAQVLKAADVPSFGDLFRYIRLHRGIYLPFAGAAIFSSMAGGGWTAWIAAAIGRVWNLSPGQIGAVAGPLLLIGTPLGFLISGIIMSWLIVGGHKDGTLRVVIVSQLLNLAPALLILHMPTQNSMWVAFGISALLNSGFQVAVSAILSDITPGRLMGKMVAVFNSIQVVLGLAMGPTVFAFVAEYCFSGNLAIVDAITVCFGVATIIAVSLLVFVARGVRRWHLTNVMET